MKRYCRTTIRECPLYYSVCADKVIESIAEIMGWDVQKSAAHLEKHVGRYQRGKHIGQLRGSAVMEIVIKAGFEKIESGRGREVHLGQVLYVTVVDFLHRTLPEILVEYKKEK